MRNEHRQPERLASHSNKRNLLSKAHIQHYYIIDKPLLTVPPRQFSSQFLTTSVTNLETHFELFVQFYKTRSRNPESCPNMRLHQISCRIKSVIYVGDDSIHSDFFYKELKFVNSMRITYYLLTCCANLLP